MLEMGQYGHAIYNLTENLLGSSPSVAKHFEFKGWSMRTINTLSHFALVGYLLRPLFTNRDVSNRGPDLAFTLKDYFNGTRVIIRLCQCLWSKSANKVKGLWKVTRALWRSEARSVVPCMGTLPRHNPSASDLQNSRVIILNLFL